MRKLTNEEFLRRLKERNPEVQAIGEYLDYDTPIKVKCDNNHEWFASPSNLTKSKPTHCPFCKKSRKDREKSDYINKLKNFYPDIVLIGEYVNQSVKTRFRCNHCGEEFVDFPRNLLAHAGIRQGCVNCNIEIRKLKQIVTHEDIINRFKECRPDLIVLGRFTSFKEKILVKSTKCGHEWNADISHILKSKDGCPYCKFEKRKMSQEEFCKKLAVLNPTIELVDKYINNGTKIEFKCKVCNKTFMASPNAVTRIDNRRGKADGCPYCGKKLAALKRTKPLDKFKEELNILHPDLKLIGKYANAKSTVEVFCKKCGKHFITTPDCLINQKHGCLCQTSSHGEQQILHYLQNNNIEYIQQKTFDKCKNINSLPFDFYLPTYNLCIEYDGQQHFQPVNFGGCSDITARDAFNKTVKHDKVKTDFCKNNHIGLLRIPYWDFDNIPNILNKELHIKEAVLSPAQ